MLYLYDKHFQHSFYDIIERTESHVMSTLEVKPNIAMFCVRGFMCEFAEYI